MQRSFRCAESAPVPVRSSLGHRRWLPVSVKASSTEAKHKRAASAVEAGANETVEELELESDENASADVVLRRLQRLALDVHDGPMQNLAVIGFSLGTLRQRLRTVVPSEHRSKLDAGLKQITEELGKVEADLRVLIGALEDGVAGSVPLREALEAEIRGFGERSDATVSFRFDENAHAETDSQRIALQSVTRAALANVAKHAGATEVSVTLTASDEMLRLEIKDNGCGFAADGPPKPGRFGLAGMRRRVEMLGGELQVTSAPGGPTVVSASLEAWRPDEDEL